MYIIFVLIILGLILGGSFLFIFFKAASSGQFKDCQTPAVRILFDEEKPSKNKSKNNNGDINE